MKTARLLAIALPALGALLGCSGVDTLFSNQQSNSVDPPHGQTSTPDEDGTSSETPSPVTTPGAPLATSIVISEVALFQAVKIPLEKDGAPVTPRNAHVVAGRDALVRVYVAPQAGYTPKQLTAELTLAAGGSVLATKTDVKTIAGASSENDLGTTFDFDVAGKDLPPGVAYSVAITDPSLAGTREAAASLARHPMDGAMEILGAQSTGAALKVKLVPMAYAADGSSRLPDVSPAQIALYKDALYTRYPAATIDISVREAVTYPGAIKADGSGWDDALVAMVALRAADRAADDVYYVGLFEAAPTWAAYCGARCVNGLSGVADDENDAAVRASVVSGFSGGDSAIAAAHEIGHAHGRRHAPCGGAASADDSFPYAGGATGSWGYNLVTKRVVDPSQFKDVMGYCTPGFVSDYTYEAFFHRMQHVASVKSAASVTSGAPAQASQSRVVHVDGSGALRLGPAVSAISTADGAAATHDITFHDAFGNVIASSRARFYAYGDLPGGFMLAPEAPADAREIRVVGPRVASALRLDR